MEKITHADSQKEWTNSEMFQPRSLLTLAEKVWGWVESEDKNGFWIHHSGAKSEVFARKSQHGNDNLKVGDYALFVVVSEANEFSPAEVSFADGEIWQELHRAKQESRSLKVTVTRIHRADNDIKKLFVRYKGINGVLPYSLMSVPHKEVADLLNCEIEVKVHDVSLVTQRLIFNQRRVQQEKARKQLRDELATRLIPGSILRRVPVHSFYKSKSGMEQGIFIQLDGCVGLIHRNELPQKFLRGALSTQFKPGDLIDAMVLPCRQKADGSKHIALSLKAIVQTQQQDFVSKLQVGDQFEVSIDRQVEYGYFVCLSKELDVDGLLHNKHIPLGSEPKLGSRVKVKLISVEPDRQRIGLALSKS